MTIGDWWKRNFGKTEERTQEVESQIYNIRTMNAFDSVQREESVLNNLKKEVYNQDQTKIKELLVLFDNLSSQQMDVGKKIAEIKTRLSSNNVKKGYKKRISSLIKKLENAGKTYDNLASQSRNSIERIKASIKANDFQFAEALINKALELSHGLKVKAAEIDRDVGEVNRVMQLMVITPNTARRTP
ncbi:MAG: hypothetical protein AABX61_03675 [Nanoarchaeota archaeon]